MKAKNWLIGWGCLTLTALFLIGSLVVYVDPYFHYHAPKTDQFFYGLYNQRSQNDGILRHFDYDAVITGTSMTENFRTTELDELFGVSSVKTSFSGGSYYEINRSLEAALRRNPKLRLIVRGLDLAMFFDDVHRLRDDLGDYPDYLYDNNPFNDVRYLFEKSTVISCANAVLAEHRGGAAGITSFDDYARWQSSYTFGRASVLGAPLVSSPAPAVHLSNVDRTLIYENITQNVTALADTYSDVDFYYFLTPYSAAWWSFLVNDGTVYRQIEAEQYVIELILPHENIHLFSFNAVPEIVADLNNYKDLTHYADWINSVILRYMHDGKYLLTAENYRDYIARELDFFITFDYESLNTQEDYQDDTEAVLPFLAELAGTSPRSLPAEDVPMVLSGAEILPGQHNGTDGIVCTGSLSRPTGDMSAPPEYLLSTEYIGAKFTLNDLSSYRYLTFYGKKLADHGQPSVYVYDSDDTVVSSFTSHYSALDNQWHLYTLTLPALSGGGTIIFNGGYIDCSGDPYSTYIFSDITLF